MTHNTFYQRLFRYIKPYGNNDEGDDDDDDDDMERRTQHMASDKW